MSKCQALPGLLAIACLLATGLVAAAHGEDVQRSIHLEVVIADLPGAVQLEGGATAAALLRLEKAGQLGAVQRIQLSTVDGQPGHVQFGGNVNVPQGRTFSRGGQAAVTAYTMLQVGTMVQLTPQIQDDGRVLVELAIERSQLEQRPAAESGEEADVQTDAPPAGMEVLNVKSTVRLKPDEPTLVSGRRLTEGNKGSQTWIVFTAKLESGRPADADEASRSQDQSAIPGASSRASRNSVAPSAAPATDAQAQPLPKRSESRSAAASGSHEVKVYALQNATASRIATVLQEVFATEPLRVSADPRTNSVLVTAPRRTLDMVSPLVQRLDER